MCRMVCVGDRAGHAQGSCALEGAGVKMGWAGKENGVGDIEEGSETARRSHFRI